MITVAVAIEAARPQPGLGDLRLAPGRAGALEVGAPIDEIYKLFGREHTQLVDLYLEGMYSPALKVTLPGASADPALVVRLEEWPCHQMTAYSITVTDRRYRTADGFGVGTTGAELGRRHPFKINEEEGSYGAFIETLQMGFSFEREPPIDKARVTSVMLVLHPGEVRRPRCPELGPIGEPAPGATVGPKDQLRALIDNETGLPATDCGQHVMTRIGDDWVPANRELVEKSLACVLARAASRQASSTFRQQRGSDSWIASGWISDHSGKIRKFVFDSQPCGGSGCAPRFDLTPCDHPAIVPTANGEFDLSCSKPPGAR
ncbi:MAG TPA: hypothetical protein VJN96_12805 [Vicinamibacterales bacterium]|nr:hypothetical protein [Vicinamibacterales bacterium]